VEHLRVSIRSGRAAIPLVDDLSFELAAGEIVGLVGESGCGKTITAAALLGLAPEPSGRVTIGRMQLDGRDLAHAGEHRWREVRGNRISMIFQDPLTALDPVFTIGAQLREVIRRHQSCSKLAAQERAIHALQSLGLADASRLMQIHPHELSGGMRQRVMIAMAMACQPLVLIADEPNAALDVATQAQILVQLRKLARDTGTAILLITHDLHVVARVCDRAMIMYCGRLAEQGPVASLFANPRHPYTAALLAALPSLQPEGTGPMQPIPGSVPPLHDLPSGCRFRNRCTRADDQCRDAVPGWVDSGPGHGISCHHPLPGYAPGSGRGSSI
jgi:oligopeptide/dipeptide ABC transporter ATP-binding protein